MGPAGRSSRRGLPLDRWRRDCARGRRHRRRVEGDTMSTVLSAERDRTQTTSLRQAPVSVIVPVKNEAANLRRCLPALCWADEVFVVDSQSSDETIRVAEEFGARVVQFRFNGTYPKKKNWALENLPFRNEWVLIVD